MSAICSLYIYIFFENFLERRVILYYFVVETEFKISKKIDKRVRDAELGAGNVLVNINQNVCLLLKKVTTMRYICSINEFHLDFCVFLDRNDIS